MSDSTDKQKVLSGLCAQLEKILDGCRLCVSNMDQLTKQMNIVGKVQSETDVLFLTWPLSKFGKFRDGFPNGPIGLLCTTTRISGLSHRASSDQESIILFLPTDPKSRARISETSILLVLELENYRILQDKFLFQEKPYRSLLKPTERS